MFSWRNKKTIITVEIVPYLELWCAIDKLFLHIDFLITGIEEFRSVCNWTFLQIRHFLQPKSAIFFLFVHENICCGTHWKHLSEMLLKYTQNIFHKKVCYVSIRSTLVKGLLLLKWCFFISCHTIVAGYFGFTFDVGVSVCLMSVRPSVRFSFLDDNFSKHQWIFTKLGMCIDIVEIWFGIANGQILSNFYGVTCPRHAHIIISR